jgi:cysteine-rich repeat protein
VDIGPYPAIDLSCGDSHTCVVVQGPEKRRAVCWGSNEYGQLGYPHIKGNVGDEESPAEAGFVDIPDDIASIVLGSDHTCILTAHGTIKCWGHGADGRLGYTGQSDIRDPSSVDDMSMTCGDGIKQYNEMCDDGNFIDGDGCSKFCKIEESWTCRSTSGTFSLCALCGDYLASLDETCDDGNTNSDDGCSSSCEIETGWECAIRGTVCNPIRGDGLIVGRETCDSGNVTGAVGCSSDSQILPGFYCKSQPSVCYSVCGDGKKSSQEACDDGNIDSGDGCSSGCNIESGWTCYVSCDQYLTCKSECSSNNSDSKVGLIVGLCVGLSLCVILLLILLFFFMGKKRQILIKESDLTLIRKIGEGDFGEVYEAKWKSTTVAVKQRKIDGISEEEIKMFSKEARVMQALPPHPNLVQFLGLCSTSDKLIIVCEYVEKGSVKRFLQEDCGKNTVTKRNQLELCLGICAGMDHLHSNGITHRDLACRNVLVEVKRSGNGSSLVSKISDFGLSVATSKQTRLPVRWTAPEVLKNPRSRNKEADVWSFGVTMYEVFTRCSELPYLGKKNQEVVAFVLGGGHLKEPPQVDGTIRDLMMDCFKFKPEWRPNFITLSARFEDIIKDMTNPTMTSNDTFSTIDTVETTSLQMFSDDDENDYMSMAKSEYSTSALTSSNVKKGNTYEVVKSTDYESLAK